jgi:hypothetical protein
MFLNGVFTDETTGNIKVRLAMCSEVATFIEEVKLLCDNDPTQNNGFGVIFEFSQESRFGNFVEFDRLFKLRFGG